MFQIRAFMSVAFVLAAFSGRAFANDDSWFFSPAEITKAYRYQQQFGARLHNPLRPQACFHGENDFTAAFGGKQFAAPCKFVNETVRQLRALLESGAAKYLFPLDVDAADLAVPAEIYASKYRYLRKDEILPTLLREPSLIAVYHTAVHVDPALSDQAAEGLWGKRRAIAGFYDGRPNRMLPLGSDGRVDYEAAKLIRIGSLSIMSHFLGELTLIASDGAVTFDLSFDSDRAAANPAEFAAVRSPAR